MLSFSTQDLPAEQRFEQWREIRGKNLFGVTIELPLARRLAFQGAFRAHQVCQPEIAASIRAGLRQGAMAIIAKCKHRPALNPAMVATEPGISLRQVHILFEEAAMPFFRTLAAMLIDEARKLLLGLPGLPVAQIAHACGFDRLATFYRVFRSSYGLSPGDMRHMSQQDT